MNIQWVWLGTFAFALGACSSHSSGGSVLPQDTTSGPSSAHSNAALSSAASCAIIPGTTSTAFAGSVGGVSDSDAWNIYSGEPGTGTTMKFEHITGSGWHSVSPPVIPNQSSYQVIYLFGVVPIASNDVWTSGQGVGKVNPGQNRTAFFLHWDGTAWNYVPSAASLTNQYGIVAIAGDASNDVWAIASSQTNSLSVQLERWDGSKWSFVASQSIPVGFVGPAQLVVFGPNDVWMTLVSSFNTVVGHWNGSTLTTTGLPYLNGGQPLNGSFGGTADDDLWYDTSNVQLHVAPYIAHRSSSWGLYNTSEVGAAGFSLQNVVDFKRGYALIVANDQSGNSALLVYNGYVRWRPTADPFPATAHFFETSIVKGTTSFWTSFYTDQLDTVGIAGLVRCPSTAPAPL